MVTKEDVGILKRFKETIHLKKPVEETLYSRLLSTYPISKIKTKQDYKRSLKILESAMEYYEFNKETLNKSNKKSFEQFISIYALFIEEYETEKFQLPVDDITSQDVLTFLISEHQLNQTDLAKELGGQSVVSNILNGKRELSRKQIESLSKRFNISPSVFFRV